MTTKNNTTKILSKIPKEIKNKYRIRNQWRNPKDRFIEIHNPSYINIDDDGHLEVTERQSVFCIQNNKVSVSLWKNDISMHTTVY